MDTTLGGAPKYLSMHLQGHRALRHPFSALVDRAPGMAASLWQVRATQFFLSFLNAY